MSSFGGYDTRLKFNESIGSYGGDWEKALSKSVVWIHIMWGKELNTVAS